MTSILWLAMQAAAVAITPAVSCSVAEVRTTDAPVGRAGLLVAGCGAHGVPLGAASRYGAVSSPGANGLLHVHVYGARIQFLLASPAQDGAGVAVNDLTRELVGLTGKSSSLGIDAATIDIAQSRLTAVWASPPRLLRVG